MELEVQSRKEEEKIEAETAAKLVEEEATTKIEKEDMEGTVGTEEKSLKLVFPSLPVNPWRPLPEIPIERIGSGLNKKVRIYGAFNYRNIKDDI